MKFLIEFALNFVAGMVGNCITEVFFKKMNDQKRSSTEIDGRVLEEHIQDRTKHVEVFSLVRRAVSVIAFERRLFPQSLFREWHTSSYDLTTKVLEPGSAMSSRLLELLDRGLFVALQQEAMTCLRFLMFTGVGETKKLIDCYDFYMGYERVGEAASEIEADPECSVKDCFQSLQQHLDSTKVHLDDKGPWTIELHLTLRRRMEVDIPFFREEDVVYTEGQRSTIGSMVNSSLSCVLTVVDPRSPMQTTAREIVASSSHRATPHYVARVTMGDRPSSHVAELLSSDNIDKDAVLKTLPPRFSV